jgi:hypothetical protein
MKDEANKRVAIPAESLQPCAKKPYQTPQLTVHGRVDEITQLLAFCPPGSHC